MEVLNNHVTMLAESAERPEEIDRARAESAKERAAKRLAERKADIDLERAKIALARSLNRLKVSQKA